MNKVKNNLNDLKNALFLQIENIQNPEDFMVPEEEIKKAGAICKLAEQIVKINQVELDAVKTCILLKKNGVERQEVPLLEELVK